MDIPWISDNSLGFILSPSEFRQATLKLRSSGEIKSKLDVYTDYIVVTSAKSKNIKIYTNISKKAIIQLYVVAITTEYVVPGSPDILYP